MISAAKDGGHKRSKVLPQSNQRKSTQQSADSKTKEY
jgi:hypothetical protein